VFGHVLPHLSQADKTYIHDYLRLLNWIR
jgi:hypothetical protein